MSMAIMVDLGNIITGKRPDIEIWDKDVIIIPEGIW